MRINGIFRSTFLKFEVIPVPVLAFLIPLHLGVSVSWFLSAFCMDNPKIPVSLSEQGVWDTAQGAPLVRGA